MGPVHPAIPLKNSARMRRGWSHSRRFGRETAKSDSSLYLVKKNSSALCMLSKLGYTDPKLTFFDTDRGNEVDEWAKVLFLPVLYHHGGWTRPNSISILAWPKYIYAWCCLRAQKSPTVFHPYGFPTNLERIWIEFPKSWSEQKRTGLQFELGKILFDQCSRVSSARVFFYWKTDYIVPRVGWIKEIISYAGIIHVVYFRWEGSKMHQGVQTKVCEVNRSSMDWPNWTQQTALGASVGLWKTSGAGPTGFLLK